MTQEEKAKKEAEEKAKKEAEEKAKKEAEEKAKKEAEEKAKKEAKKGKVKVQHPNEFVSFEIAEKQLEKFLKAGYKEV